MDTNDKEFRLKDCYNVLGENWEYEFRPDAEENYSDTEFLRFGDYLTLTLALYDPYALQISYDRLTMLEISFGPINCFHYQQDLEPRVIIESFVDDRVNFLEVKSDGTIHLYHYFNKDSYRTLIAHHPVKS